MARRSAGLRKDVRPFTMAGRLIFTRRSPWPNDEGMERPMPEPTIDPTATFEARRSLPTTTFAPVDLTLAKGLDQELRTLLRARLILVHLLGLFFLALLAA